MTPKRRWRPPQLDRDATRDRAAVPSWIISVCVHLAVYFLLATTLQFSGGGTPGPGDGDFREVGIYIKESPDGTAPGPESNALDEDQQSQAASTAQTLPPTTPAQPSEAELAKSVGENLDRMLQNQPERRVPDALNAIGAGPAAGADQGSALPLPSAVGSNDLLNAFNAAGSAGGSVRPGGGGLRAGGSGATRFFDISAQGTRFVYVVDQSGSMGFYRQHLVAKSELLASLQSLDATQQFQVIFYNDRLFEFRGRDHQATLNWATDINKTLMRQFIAGTQPDGGTDHMAALLKGLSYRPEHLFLLTDADQPTLSEADLNRIKRANGGRTKIHCVEFGKGTDLALETNFLKKLARQNDGTYRYRDITQFGER